MMERLFKSGLITTILGFLVIVFCGAMIWTDRSTFEECAGWFAFGVTLLRSKDTIIGRTIRANEAD